MVTDPIGRGKRGWTARVSLALVLLVVIPYGVGVLPRTQRFRERAFRGQWLDGFSTDTASAILGDCQERNLWWYYLGPAGKQNYWNDYMFGDRERAALLVHFDGTETVRFNYVLRHHEDQGPEPFSPSRWQASAAKERLALAHEVVKATSLIGLSIGEVTALLGDPDDTRHFLVYRVSDGWGTDPRRLPIGYDGRIDHSLPCEP